MSDPKPQQKKLREHSPMIGFFVKRVKAFVEFLIYSIVGKK